MPVKTLKFFSHGTASLFRFDMDGPGDSACSLGRGQVASFDPASFFPDATVVAYSCRIGNSSGAEFLTTGTWRDEAKPENSLAQKLADQLELPVHGYLTRTEYSATWNQDGAPSIKASNVKIHDPFRHNLSIRHPLLWATEEADRVTDKVLWNDEGAHRGVTASATPGWLKGPESMCRFIFKPGAAPTADGDP